MPCVLFTAAAQADLGDALAWYEAHAREVVPQFRQALRAVVQRIGENPKQFRLRRSRRVGRFSAASPIS